MTGLNHIRVLLFALALVMLYLCSAPPADPFVLRMFGAGGLVLALALWLSLGCGLWGTAGLRRADRSGFASDTAILSSDNVPLGMIELDHSGCIVTVNALALSMLGYRAEELIGCNLHSTVHDLSGSADDGSCLLCSSHAPLPPESRSFTLWSKSGLRVPVEATLVCSSEATTQKTVKGRTLVLLQDLRASTLMAEKVYAFFTAAPNPLLLFDGDAHLIDVNPAAASMFAVEQNVLKASFARFIPLVQPDGEPSAFAQQLRSAHVQGNSRFTFSFCDTHGTEIATEVSLVPICYAGAPALCVSLYDIRTLLAASKSVELELTRLHLVVNASPIAMCVLHKGLVEEHNERLTELVKLNRGDDFADAIVNSVRRDALREQLDRQGYVSEFEMAAYTPDGSIAHVMVTALRVEWEGAPRTLCWLVDISRLKEVEHALVIARDEAEEATRVKSSFLARMSHEIRTPMNAIIGMSYLCRQTGLSPHQAQYMDKLEAAADALVGIFSDILEFTLLQSGQLEISSAPFSLSETLEKPFAIHKEKALCKGVEWSVDIAADVPDALFGDGTRLAQILSGLLSNALKFTEQGHIGVRIARTLESDKSIWLHFSVSDSGIGMSQSQVGEVFELFSQGDPSLTRRHGGIGLGLTISKYLTELLGGRIWAESEEGRGSTFHCTIPFRQPAAPCAVVMPRLRARPEEYALDTEFPLPEPEELMPATPEAINRRVLLVEDNEINQEIACELLRDLGLDPHVAENGALAVAAAAEENFELIFMDIQMPVMDGLEATQKIRAHDSEWARTVPIIAMTAHAMQDDRDQSLAVGMNEHLTKPIDPLTLQRVVSRWICCLPDTLSAGDARPEPSSINNLHRLYGLNVAAGVANVVGNEKLYCDLLRRFAVKYRDSHTELSHLLNQHDIEGASRLAHTIKGVAANLGANTLADLVKKIEIAILTGIDMLPDLELYRRELKLVTSGIDALGQTPQLDTSAFAQAHTLGVEAVTRILQELDALPELMQTDWGQAQEKVEALAEALSGSDAAPACTLLRNALEEFDVLAFTKAAQAVREHL